MHGGSGLRSFQYIAHQGRQKRMRKLLKRAQDSLRDTDDDTALLLLTEAAPLLKEETKGVDNNLLRDFLSMMSRFNLDEARSVYVEAVRNNTTDELTSIHWVRILVSKGQQDESRDILYSLPPGPFEAERHTLLGMSWMDSGDMVQAAKSLQESTRWDNQREAPYHLMEQMDPQGNWGLVHQIEKFDFKDQESSRELFLEEVNGKGPVIRLAKALHLWHSESPEASMAAWKAIRSRNNDNLLLVKVGARMAFHIGRFDQCVERYEEALRLDPTNAGVMQEYGDVLIDMGNPNQAITVLDRLLVISPGNRKAMMSKMRAYSKLGDKRGCSDIVDVFVSSPHWDDDSQPVVIEMLIACGAHQEAQRRLDGLLSKKPRDLQLLRLSIKNHTMARNFDDAVRIADTVMKISDEGFDDHMVKATIQFQKGDLKGTKRTLANMLRLQPSYLPALTLLKDVAKEERDEVAVMELCNQILHLDPDNVGAMKDKAGSLHRTGAYAESMEMYIRVLQTPGSDPALLKEVLTTLVSNSRYMEACSISDSLLDMHGDDWEIWTLRGNSLFGAGRMDDAAQAYSKATSWQGNDSLLWFSRGMALEQSGQLQDALDCYDKAIVRDLGNTEAWMGKAIVLERMGDLKESLRNLDQVLKTDPGHRNALIKKARLLVRMEKHLEAIYFLDMAIKLDRRDITSWTLRKEVMKHVMDHNGVVLTCDEILRLKEDDHLTLMDKAKALQSLKQQGDALKVLTRLQRLHPEDLSIMLSRKDSLSVLGREDEAIVVLEEMIQLRPDDKSLLLDLLDMQLSRGEDQGALQTSDRILSLDPMHSRANHAKADLLVNLNKYDEALELLASMRHRGLWDASSLSLVSKAQLGIGNPSESLSAAEEGLQSDPSMEDLHVSRCLALLQLGHMTEVLDASEEGLKASPQSPRIWRCRGDAFFLSGDTVNALNSYDRAVGFGDNDPETHFQRALAQKELGKMEQAAESLKRALQYQPDHAQAWSLLGVLQTELGNYREAKKSLETASSHSPDDLQTLLRRARLHAVAGESRKAVEIYEEMEARGIKDANLLVEKGELLVSMKEKLSARDAFLKASDLDPFLPGLAEMLTELESEIHQEGVQRAARSILESNYKDGKPLDVDYVRSRSEERYFQDLQDIILSEGDGRRPLVWSPEFESLETLSRQVLLSIGEKEGMPLRDISLAQVYMRLPERDIQRAKDVRSHIIAALSEDLQKCDIISTRVHAVREAIAGRENAPGLIEVMRKYDLGPYASRLALEAWKGRSQ